MLSAIVVGLYAPLVQSGYFDCSVVYDEFDSLMNNQFLIEPGRYVATASQRLTHAQYEELQRDRFKLHEERSGLGVLVFRTGMNVHGKALFRFAPPIDGGTPDLLVEHTIVFARVADGYAPRWLAPLRVKAGGYVDLDSGDTDNRAPLNSTSAEAARFDLVYHSDPGSGELIIEAVPPAALFFPIESLCHGPGDGKR
ncbi:MAG: hypothetical protein OES09_01040 [Gammaproteobacteria bacterium]|nr:hypothetical protein [Gammaproteobacteria bacterium]